MFIPIVIATATISFISLLGVLLIFKQEHTSKNLLRSLISLAAGSLLAVAFLDLLPEAIEESQLRPHTILGVTLLSILVFFGFERTLHWHHCSDELHADHELHQKKNLIYLNLIGDATHNLIDGFLVAAAFLLNFEAGIIVSLAVILHEIPQEISDFGVLLYAGLSKTKAILYNLGVAVTAVIGAIVFYYFGTTIEVAIPVMAAAAAGNFIYLATADLIPELHHERNPNKVVHHSLWLLLGVLLIYTAGLLLPHSRG